MSKYKGLFTFDIDNHRYIPIGQADGIVVVNDADYVTTEPLIKDPKIRKAVRAWAEANDIEDGITYLGYGEFRSYLNTTIDFAILVNEHRFDLLKKNEEYTITELCGEEDEKGENNAYSTRQAES